MKPHLAPYIKKQFWKHNAVLITTINQTFNEGIILDAWKNSGDFLLELSFKRHSL